MVPNFPEDVGRVSVHIGRFIVGEAGEPLIESHRPRLSVGDQDEDGVVQDVIGVVTHASKLRPAGLP